MKKLAKLSNEIEKMNKPSQRFADRARHMSSRGMAISIPNIAMPICNSINIRSSKNKVMARQKNNGSY